MELFKNKLVILLGVALLICIFFFWSAKEPMQTIDKEKLEAWLKTSYSTQFCNVIFPHIENCVSLKPAACDEVVKKSLDSCLDQLPQQEVTISESKKIYAGASSCFENNIHSEIVSNYLIDTPECRKRLS